MKTVTEKLPKKKKVTEIANGSKEIQSNKEWNWNNM